MEKRLVVKRDIEITASPAKVWDALINPAVIKQYMFGTDTVSDWKKGSSIVFKGVWEGKAYEDKGTILKFEPEHLLQYTHWSNLSGQPDIPENYHTVTFELSHKASHKEVHTHLKLSQDNNPTEQAREHSGKMWESVLKKIKELVEE